MQANPRPPISRDSSKLYPSPSPLPSPLLPSCDFALEALQKFIELVKQDLDLRVQSPETNHELTSILDKYSLELNELLPAKFSERVANGKTSNSVHDKQSKNIEKKIAVFQKEARKSSVERRFEIKEIKPVRASINRSVSPGEKRNFTQENLELKDQLRKVSEERDVLRAWKENVLKLPGNFSEDPNSLFKEHEICKKQLMIQNKVLAMKIQAMSTALSKFIKDTALTQKNIREKEGFSSLNFYETEKSKLEVKIKELSEVKDIPQVNIDSTDPKNSQNFDFSQYSEKIISYENENKVLKNQLRELKKNIKVLEIKCAELENIRWQSEREKNILERKNKTSVTPTGNKKHFIMVSKQMENIKTWAENRIKDLSSGLESKYEELSLKVSEKEEAIIELKNRITEKLKENLNLLIAMNENARNQSVDKGFDEIYKSQIENLEFIIEQHRTYTDIKVKELNETIDSFEKERNFYMKKTKRLEQENSDLKLEINRLKDLEISLSNSKIMIVELEDMNKNLVTRLRITNQKEREFDQIQFEKSFLNSEILRLNEELEKKDRAVMELQQTLTLEQIQANNCLEELLFKEKTVKSELEMVKIEMNNFKSEVKILEKVNQELQEKLDFLENKSNRL